MAKEVWKSLWSLITSLGSKKKNLGRQMILNCVKFTKEINNFNLDMQYFYYILLC